MAKDTDPHDAPKRATPEAPRDELEKGLLATRVGLALCDRTDERIGQALDAMEPRYRAEAERLREHIPKVGIGQGPAAEDRYMAILRGDYHARKARSRLAGLARSRPATADKGE